MSDEQKKESTEVVKKDKPASIQVNGRGLSLTTIEDMYRFAQYVVSAGLAPKGMEKPEAVVIALEMGMEVGLVPMQAIQNICVVNGRATIWGDAVPGLVHSSGLQEYYTQKKIGTPGTDSYGYEVTSKRKGNPEPIVTSFTVADARKAQLWGKSGPWTFYPDRMLLNRARAFNARDNFPDVLKGLYTTEEIQDVEFEVVDNKPLADGEKTSNLAERLTAQAKAEDVPFEDVPPEPTHTVDVRQIEPEAPETSKRGRPRRDNSVPEEKQEATQDDVQRLISKMKSGEVTREQVKEAAQKAGVVFSVPQALKPHEAVKILERLT